MKHLLASIFVLLTCAAAGAADFTPPPEAIPLEDPRMAEFYGNPANAAVITGRFRNVPEALRETLTLSCVFTTLGEERQVERIVPVQADGSFRFVFDDAFSLREAFLIVTAGGQRVLFKPLLVTKDLDLELEFVPDRRAPGVKLTGTDAELTAAANDFLELCRARLPRLAQDMNRVADRKTDALEEALAELARLRQAQIELLEAHAPAKFGWVLREQVEVQYLRSVLELGFRNEKSIESYPAWKDVMAFRPCIMSTPSMSYYGYLGIYLRTTGPDARMTVVDPFGDEMQALVEKRLRAANDPELLAQHREAQELRRRALAGESVDGARLQELTKRLSQAGLFGTAAVRTARRISQYRERIPAEKLDFVLIKSVQSTSTEAREVYACIAEFVGPRWPRLFLARATDSAATQLAGINATLARAVPLASAEADDAAVQLPSGARLHQWPGLSRDEVLARLKSIAPGKALMIDFWGPWCSPCLEDLPHSQKIHHAMQDAAVEFVYFGCRTNEKEWKAAIARFGLSGTHVLLNDEQSTALMTLFGKAGYPSYILIDRAGRYRPQAIGRFSDLTADRFRQLIE